MSGRPYTQFCFVPSCIVHVGGSCAHRVVVVCRHLRRRGGDRSARATVCPSYCTPVMLAHLRLPHLCCVHLPCAVRRSCTACYSQHARTSLIRLSLHLNSVHLSAARYMSSFIFGSVLLGAIGPFFVSLASPSCVPGRAPISADTYCSLSLVSSVTVRSYSALYHRTHTSTPSAPLCRLICCHQPLSRLLSPSPALVGSRRCLLGP